MGGEKLTSSNDRQGNADEKYPGSGKIQATQVKKTPQSASSGRTNPKGGTNRPFRKKCWGGRKDAALEGKTTTPNHRQGPDCHARNRQIKKKRPFCTMSDGPKQNPVGETSDDGVPISGVEQNIPDCLLEKGYTYN